MNQNWQLGKLCNVCLVVGTQRKPVVKITEIIDNDVVDTNMCEEHYNKHKEMIKK